MRDKIPCVTASLPPTVAETLFELIDSNGFTPTSWHDLESGVSRVYLFPDNERDVERATHALIATARLLGVEVTPEVVWVAQADWAESWKRFFHVEKVSERVVVRPSWEEYTSASGECVITLDPGLSFGTGKHATTRACLILLDRLARENPCRSVLDMGCGSGILAIGALLLGFTDVRAFDNDPECIKVTNENAAINRVTLPVYLADLTAPHPAAEIVVANILAPVLIEFAPQVAASLRPGGQSRLILSGILDTQYSAVRTAYEAQGLNEIDSILLENWRSGLFCANKHAN